MFPSLFTPNRRLPLIGAVLVAAVLCTPAAALSPPAPPAPTIAEIVASTQVVFTGRVESVVWQPIIPGRLNSGDIALNVRVAERLLGNARVIPKRIIYVAGSAGISEAQAKERYEGRSFVFVGYVFRLPSGEMKIMMPPSGDPPYELSTVPEFRREIAKSKAIFQPQKKWPGPR